MTDRLRSAIARGPVILDAAMGTRLLARGLDLRDDDPCLWNLSRPDVVSEIHRLDIAAGADAVLTNTFGANRAWLARFHRAQQVAVINRSATRLAREAAGPERAVIGSIGPTAAGEPDAYREQAEALVEAGVDALVLETHRAEQAELALNRIAASMRVPVLISLLAWPEPLVDWARRFENQGAVAIGGNCQPGMEQALALAEALRRETDLPIFIKPSAGRPGDVPARPESFARAVPRLRALGAILVGGCCGTTEAHVEALGAACYHARNPGPGASSAP